MFSLETKQMLAHSNTIIHIMPSMESGLRHINLVFVQPMDENECVHINRKFTICGFFERSWRGLEEAEWKEVIASSSRRFGLVFKVWVKNTSTRQSSITNQNLSCFERLQQVHNDVRKLKTLEEHIRTKSTIQAQSWCNQGLTKRKTHEYSLYPLWNNKLRAQMHAASTVSWLHHRHCYRNSNFQLFE